MTAETTDAALLIVHIDGQLISQPVNHGQRLSSFMGHQANSTFADYPIQ